MQNITLETVKSRHSVRSYLDKPLAADVRAALEAEIDACNREGNLAMSLVCDEPAAFDSAMAHYGKFSGVQNYVIVAGPAADDLEERAGYYGERVVLLAQSLGLNTCWVAMTFKKRFVKKAVAPGNKLVVVISLGYGATQGAGHAKSKTAEQVSALSAGVAEPDWFARGVEWALLAPTAMNQQSFLFTLVDAGEGGSVPVVRAEAKGGFYSKVDLGIVKLHFELGAAPQEVAWA